MFFKTHLQVYLFLTFSFVLLFKQAEAQREPSFVGSGEFLEKVNKGTHLFSLLFKDTTGNDFNTVRNITIYRYVSSDTSLSNKSLEAKIQLELDRIGDVISSKKYDNAGFLYDSIITVYDDSFREIHRSYYGTQDTLRPLHLYDDRYYVRDTHGNILKDSERTRGEQYWEGPFTIFCQYYKYTYDKAGNNIKRAWIKNPDTVINIKKYDNKNRCTASYTNANDVHRNSDWTKYDDSSNVLEEGHINQHGDTSKTINGYNEKKRKILYIYYKRGKLFRSRTTNYNNDGSYVRTLINYQDDGYDEQGHYCFIFGRGEEYTGRIESKTIANFDKHGNETSSVEIRYRKGDSTITNTIHNYQFTSDRKLISDTETIEKQGYMKSSKTQNITLNKYDAQGNLIEHVQIEGNYPEDNNKETYSYNEKDKLLESDYYKGCGNKPQNKKIKIYYQDGVTLKKEYEINGNGYNYNVYGTDTRLLEMVRTYAGVLTQIVIEYK